MNTTRTLSTLTIIRPTLTPDELSAFIGMHPDTWQTKGHHIIHHGTNEVSPKISKHNIWTLWSDSERGHEPLFHLNRILERVAPYADKIATLAKDNKVWIENIAYTDDGEPFLKYSPQTIQQIARLGAEFLVGSRLDFVRGDLVEKKFHEHGFFSQNGKLFNLRYDQAAAYVDACNDEDLAIHAIWFSLAAEKNPSPSNRIPLPFRFEIFDPFEDPTLPWKQIRLKCNRMAKSYLKKATKYADDYLKEHPAEQSQFFVEIFCYDWYWWQSNLRLQATMAAANNDSTVTKRNTISSMRVTVILQSNPRRIYRV